MKRIGLFESELPNGLSLIHLQTGPSSLFEASVYFPVGSRHETEASNGISHLLEHMMYRGSASHESSLSFSRALEALCGETNAFTSAESTEFWFQCDAQYAHECLLLLKDFLLAPRFNDFETEKRIILKEMAEDYNEAGHLTEDHTLAMTAHFGNAGLGLPIGGTPSGLASLKKDDLEKRAQLYYRPDQAVITVQSSESWDTIKSLCHEVFGGWKAAKTSRIQAAKPSLIAQGPHYVGVPNPDNQYTLRLSFALSKAKINSGDHLSFSLASEILERTLDDGTSSRLQAKIREEKGYVYAIQAQCDEYSDAWVFWIAATVDSEHLLQTHEAIWAELEDMKHSGPGPEEFDRSIRRAKFDLEKLDEHHHQFLERLLEARFRGIAFDSQAHVRGLHALEPKHIHRAAESFFRPENLAVVLIGPEAPELLEDLKSTH